MKPEWIIGIAAVVSTVAALANTWVTLKMRASVLGMRQEILDRVAADYKRQDVCEAEMAAVRAGCRRAA